MTIQRVTDTGSNAAENMEHAVEVIGRSRIRRAVFTAVHTGRKQSKTVEEIAKETRQSKQAVRDAARLLAQEGIIHAEMQGRLIVYRRIPFYQANRDKVLKYLDNPGSIKKLATKRRPEIRRGITRLQIPVRRNKIQAKAITIDDIQSFAEVRRVQAGEHVSLKESQVKDGLLRVLADRGQFKDWGGERNDFLTDKLMIGGRRRVAAFALKGPGKTGKLTPAKMGKNGDQIQRLAGSPAQVLVVQYYAQIADSVREQLEAFAQLKSVLEDQPIWYCIIDGDDTSRLVGAYQSQFNSKP